MNWQARLRTAFARPVDDDIVEELAQHAAATYAAARAEGCGEQEAGARVAVQIDAWIANPALRRRGPRRAPALVPPAGRSSGLAAVAQDARYAWRLLCRQPGFTAVLIGTMALGIAATTVLGSVTYGVLMKPLPWADALARLACDRRLAPRSATSSS